MTEGSTYQLNLTFRNAGSCEWNRTDVYLYVPKGGSLGYAKYAMTGTCTYYGCVTFLFNITAPQVSSDTDIAVRYTLRWKDHYNFDADVEGVIRVVNT
jgi:hypothetical protein